jgi:outer membrane protein assembly factor BamB
LKKIIILAVTLLFCISSASVTIAQPTTFNSFEGKYAEPLIVNGIIYITTSTQIFALNSTDGTKLWVAGTGSDSSGLSLGNINSIPIIENDLCYYTTDKGWYFYLNVTTGSATHFSNSTSFTVSQLKTEVHLQPLTA